MWAVVEIGKKQYMAKAGDTLEVERLKDLEGEVVFDKILLIADEEKVSVGMPYVAGAVVRAQIQGEEKGDKVHIYKYKRRKKYRRSQGHRQIHTILKISEISLK